MKLLDTCFLIRYNYGDDDAEEYRESHPSETFITTSINVKEFIVGITEAGDGSGLVMWEIKDQFDWIRFETYRDTFGFEAAQIETQLRANGDFEERLMGDILIGGAARDLQAEIVTENSSDFNMMNGVDYDSYK